MVFRDLFRPKWQHSDPGVRLRAVPELADDGILAGIVQSDPSLKVRLAALGRIQSRACLVDILSGEPAGSPSDVNAIFDAGLSKLDDLKLLAQVAIECQCEGAGCRAVSKICDDALLARIARQGKNRNITCAALDRIRSEVYLIEVATAEGVDFHVARAAMRKLSAEARGQIAMGASTPATRRCALERLTDQVVLAAVAEKDGDATVRLEAVSALADEAALARIAAADNAKAVRLEAVKRLADQSALVRVARNDSERDVRLAAAAKVTDPTLQQDLAAVMGEAEVALGKLAALGVFPPAWCEGDDGRRLLSITDSPNPHGMGCCFYACGGCLFRVQARYDMSCGPEACTVPPGGYSRCFVLSTGF